MLHWIKKWLQILKEISKALIQNHSSQMLLSPPPQATAAPSPDSAPPATATSYCHKLLLLQAQLLLCPEPVRCAQLHKPIRQPLHLQLMTQLTHSWRDRSAARTARCRSRAASDKLWQFISKLDLVFTRSEVPDCIFSLDNNKAASHDKMTNEKLKTGKLENLSWLVPY